MCSFTAPLQNSLPATPARPTACLRLRGGAWQTFFAVARFLMAGGGGEAGGSGGGASFFELMRLERRDGIGAIGALLPVFRSFSV